MNPVISAGDRVRVERIVNGYHRGIDRATVLKWHRSGKLTVKLDGSGIVKMVPPDRVKKIKDGPTLDSDKSGHPEPEAT